MPVYDEQDRVARALERALGTEYPCEIEMVVVDDGSRDRTWEILSGHPCPDCVRAATGDYLVILDADLEYDPADIPKLVRPVLDGNATVVYGSRPYEVPISYTARSRAEGKKITWRDGVAAASRREPAKAN